MKEKSPAPFIMKTARIIKFLCVLLGLTLFHSVSSAQPTVITGWTNTFPNNGNTGFYANSSFVYWYSVWQDNTNLPTHGDYNLEGTNDAAVDYTGDTNDSGSLYVTAPWSYYTNSQDQNVFYVTFSGLGPYDQSEAMQIITITNISFYIRVSTNSVPNSDGNFGPLSCGIICTNPTGNGFEYEGTNEITIPGSATNGWVLMAYTNAATFIAAATAANSGDPYAVTAFGVAWDQNSYGTSPIYPTNTLIYWIDNVTIQTATAPPPPPPPPHVSIAQAYQGLNLFTGSSSSLYNRESLETVANTYSWVGATNAVSYSFTIEDYPVGKNDEVQNHIFLIPNPGTESAPDYTEPNLIFMDLESTATGGAQWNFRYKTNEPNGNAMVYGSGTLASIATNTAIGTWTVTFNNNTNVTMTIPGGASTNFSIPDPTGATSTLFSNGVVLYYGAQAGNAGGANDHIVASDFNVTGLGAADFDDNFVADAGVLNTGLWEVNAAFPICLQMVGPGNPYWIQWSTPAPSFTLESTTSLNPPLTWTPTTTNPSFLTGTNVIQLINTGDLPAGPNAYFNLVQP
jgi:hypothetical protein